jgi:hypothetical protein
MKIKRFEQITENIINDIFDEKEDKIVELSIVDMDKEESIADIKVRLDTARKIGDALYYDRKNGGKYRTMFDEFSFNKNV